MNPYQSSGSSTNATLDRRDPSNRRRFLDARSLLMSSLSIALGASMWKMQSLISGNATFNPDFTAMIGWFAIAGLFAGIVDPRSPWIAWLSMYCGAYLLALPFFPRDPLIPLALVIGLIITGICTVIGSCIPTIIAFCFPLRSLGLRRWAGYTD